MEELLAVHALDGLDGPDLEILARERGSHGDCKRCAEIEAQFRELAGLMALSLDPQPVDTAIADSILAAGRREVPAPPPLPPVDSPVDIPVDGLEEQRGRRRRAGLTLVALAAAFALVVGAFGAYLNGTRTTTVVSASPTQRVVRFEPTTSDGGAVLAMAYTPGESGAVFWGSNLPDPGAGRTYEIWKISDDTAVSSGCFQPTNGSVAAFVDADVNTADQMAVTAEPIECPAAPTGPPLLTAPLTS